MKTIVLAAIAAVTLLAAQARAESNGLAATETPQGAMVTESYTAKVETGSETIPESNAVAQHTKNGPVARDVASEQDPMFENEVPAQSRALTVAHPVWPRG